MGWRRGSVGWGLTSRSCARHGRRAHRQAALLHALRARRDLGAQRVEQRARARRELRLLRVRRDEHLIDERVRQPRHARCLREFVREPRPALVQAVPRYSRAGAQKASEQKSEMLVEGYERDARDAKEGAEAGGQRGAQGKK